MKPAFAVRAACRVLLLSSLVASPLLAQKPACAPMSGQAGAMEHGAMEHEATEHGPMVHGSKPVVPSTSLMVTYRDKMVTLSLAELQAMPQTTVSVHNAHSNTDETYSGPLVTDVLAKAGLVFSAATEHPILRMYVVARGTDAYWVVYSGTELQPAMHKTQPIVAIAKAGMPLTDSGQFQLIDPADVKPARWVRNLAGLTVVEPSSPAM